MTPSRVSGVEEEELDSEIVVYHPENGKVYNLNGTGAFVWSLSNGEYTLEQMIDWIAEEAPGEDRDTIRSDVESFVEEMNNEGLIEVDSPDT